MLRPSCKGLSLLVLVLILFVITIHSKKKPPKAAIRGRAAPPSGPSGSDCGSTEAVLNETGKCYETGSQAVCPEMMRFYADPEADGFGDCYCEEADCEQNIFYVYWEPDDRCYPAYERGPCAEHEWLVEAAGGEVECQTNPCGKVREQPHHHHGIVGEAGSAANDPDQPMNRTGESESGPSEVLDSICACVRMEDADNGNGIGNPSESTEKLKAASQRIYRNGVTCVCKVYQFQWGHSQSNETAAASPVVNLHLFSAWSCAWAYCSACLTLAFSAVFFRRLDI